MRSRKLWTLTGLVGGDATLGPAGIVGVMFGDIRAPGEGIPADMGDFCE